MNNDPFEVLRERLVVAAGGQPARRRVSALAVAVAVLVLGGAAVAAAVTLSDGEPSKPLAGTLPTPTPTAGTPVPTTTPLPGQPRGTAPGPRSGRRRPSTVPPTTLPGPSGPVSYEIELMPDLTAGEAGWCVGVALQGPGMRTGGRSCGRAGPPDTALIAGGGMIGPAGLMYAVVDRRVTALRVSDGRRIIPKRDPAIPPSWRVAVFGVSVPAGGREPTFTLHDAAGNELSTHNLTSRGRLPTRRVSPNHPPHARCAIRARPGSHLRGVSARLLTEFETLDVVRPSFLSCATTVYYLGQRRFRAAVLLNARDLLAPAPVLPSAPRSLSARRVGVGWLAVYGGTAEQRDRVLMRLSVEGP